ncbi:hypothetical protein PN498_19360 [Oscillatoria sp. CS-180]|uniref:hypothetical protein n=1 Tax=Oscillatoria sp. CS-180 TaxID=3021720 RepID=UPI00232CD7F1|nr:hypothetical protein [Oscillatoria sp. CS-180]MDB9528159.1 hypothetical protein [Oscillatoria sp. CS-180]
MELRQYRAMLGVVASVGLGFAIASCDEVVTSDYEAMAVTTYTWRAEYRPQGVTPDRPREGRIETFETNSLVNMNGEPTVDPTGERDENGIWWPAIPPKPTVDDLEARLKDGEAFSEPLIDKSIEYSLTFDKAGETVTLPTDYSVYRQAVKAHESDQSLKLLLGAQDGYVQKAEIQ